MEGSLDLIGVSSTWVMAAAVDMADLAIFVLALFNGVSKNANPGDEGRKSAVAAVDAVAPLLPGRFPSGVGGTNCCCCFFAALLNMGAIVDLCAAKIGDDEGMLWVRGSSSSAI